MTIELGSESERPAQMNGAEAEPGSVSSIRPDSNGPSWMDDCYVPRVRPSEANGFAVYTRNKNKKLKSRSLSKIGYAEKNQGDSGASVKSEEAVSVKIEVNVGNLGASGTTVGDCDGEMMEIEVKEETMALAAVRTVGPRRITRSVLVDFEMENGNSENLMDTEILEADGLVIENLTPLGSPTTRKMEMKMSKKILIKGRPTTVKELFETGLLEGYPVFYNGGKRV